jgi:hypothetical protein
MEKISWINHVRNEEVIQRVKVDKNILQMIKIRKGNLTGNILHRKCLLKHITEGKIKGRIDVIPEDAHVRSYWITLRKRDATGN